MKYLRINKADYIGNFTVMLTFNDATVVTIDFGSWIAAHPHPQHNRYLDEKNSRNFISTIWAILHGVGTVICTSRLNNCILEA